MDIKNRYFNVPVALLKGLVCTPQQTIRNALIYCIYKAIAIEGLYENVEEMEIEFETDFEGFGLCEKSIADIGESMYDSIGDREKPYVGIHLDTLIHFHSEETTEFDRIVFVAYLALKSIIQRQPYKRITYNYLFSRMDGHSMVVSVPELSPEILQWTTRKKRTRILNYLETNFKLIRPHGNSKGIIYSFLNHKLKDGTKMTREKLEIYVQTKKIDNKKKDIQVAKKKAHDRVKAWLEKSRLG